MTIADIKLLGQKIDLRYPQAKPYFRIASDYRGQFYPELAKAGNAPKDRGRATIGRGFQERAADHGT